jgi:predicted ATPase
MSHSIEVTDIKPTSLSHLIGQRQVIDQVTVALDASQQDNKRFDHALLVGPPGLGKSALAAVIAEEMATGFHEVLGQSLNSLAELNGLLLAAKDHDIVFIDECHEIKKENQTALYLALDKQSIFVKGGSGSAWTVLRSRTRHAGWTSPPERPRRLARNSVRRCGSWNCLHENLWMPEQSVLRQVEFPFLSHVPRIFGSRSGPATSRLLFRCANAMERRRRCLRADV